MELTKRNKAYFNAARLASYESDFRRVHIGCVAVYKHKIISSSCNSTKTNPLQKKYNIYRFDTDTNHSVHAELSCLLPIMNDKTIDFSKVALYVYREYINTNKLAPSRPCKSCMELIRSLGIRKIYYTNDGSYVHEELLYE